jgi:C-terminal processing protease CtpA/Prc
MAGCGGGGGNGLGSNNICGETARKQFVLDASREWYLFPELLPASVNPADFATAEELLDHLTATAREQRKDRYFSYLTTRTEENALLGAGQFAGFGFRTRTDPGPRPFIVEVFESSPASDGGVARGDEIVAVDSGSGFVPVSQLLANGSTISDALGPSEAGVRRGLRLLRDGVTREISLTKRTVTIDPVSNVYGAKILPLAGTTGVGYLNLRTYVATADTQLRDAFAQFLAQGVDYFIVDLRYNGGGLVSTAETLNNLLGGARTTADAQLRVTHNSVKASLNETRRFQPQPQSVRPVRIAFLTTESTASASEINVNSMVPWVEIAIVGEDTYGKPVGQFAFDLSGCDDRLRLVAFRTENALGQGDYYDGLASTLDFACAAADTLEQPLGDAAEGMTSAALQWLATGACGTVIAPAPAARAKPGAPAGADRHPLPRNPSAAEYWVPGIA